MPGPQKSFQSSQAMSMEVGMVSTATFVLSRCLSKSSCVYLSPILYNSNATIYFCYILMIKSRSSKGICEGGGKKNISFLITIF